MSTHKHLLVLCVVVINFFIIHSDATSRIINLSEKKLQRSDFPKDFIFGVASAAYQVEGAVEEGGRGPSNWDVFTHQHPEMISDHSNGDVAADFYHHYKEDIRLVKELGMDAFRFSIAWSRILPRGKISEGVNEEGVRFYNNVINELIALDLKPIVTLFHTDVPQALEEEYGGFLHLNILNDYLDLVDFCFREFGDRVKHWITLNEPFVFSTLGYEKGIFPPNRCSGKEGICLNGNSLQEPYIVGHHLLLAHAAAVHLYKNNYQKSQEGVIGITNIANWYLPKRQTRAEIDAAEKSIESMLGWFLHPVVYGDYPTTLRAEAGNNLPKFSTIQSKILKGSFDFLGINYYYGAYASPNGEMGPLDSGFVYPKGIRDLMLYIKEKYNNPAIYITENGLAQNYSSTLSTKEVIGDIARVRFFEQHLWYLQEAIREGANVKGHIAWSLLDDFEWSFGYTKEYGLVYVDRKDGLKRHLKQSAYWYKKFLDASKNHGASLPEFSLTSPVKQDLSSFKLVDSLK